MSLACEVTKKTKEEMQSPPREGAMIHGLYIEGARWDINSGSIVESKLKELHSMMPVMFIKALVMSKILQISNRWRLVLKSVKI